MMPPDRNDQITSHAPVTPAIVAASGSVVGKAAQVVEHRAEADDRRHERRAEAGRLRRELLPPVVVGAGRGGVGARLVPRCASIMSPSAIDSGSATSSVSGEHAAEQRPARR